MADPAAHGHLYRETLREIEKLRTGDSDGHHPLGYESGKGDLRDCVTAYVQSTSRPLGAAEFGRRGQTTSTGPSHQAPQKGI
jgi:hypothetical protein